MKGEREGKMGEEKDVSIRQLVGQISSKARGVRPHHQDASGERHIAIDVDAFPSRKQRHTFFFAFGCLSPLRGSSLALPTGLELMTGVERTGLAGAEVP